jgi:hypothetical protein
MGNGDGSSECGAPPGALECERCDGVFAGDASLRHEEKRLREGAVDVGCGGQVGAERFELRGIQGGAFPTAPLFGGVMNAQRSTLVVALAAVGKGEVTPRVVDIIV